jgi:hypothetical protein
MKKIILMILLFIVHPLFSQEKNPEKNLKSEYDLSGIDDRASGIHNAGNIGLWFENRGKLYPRMITQGPSGEFPINSGKHYIYRVNPMVGITGNVIQGRYTTNEEWEAVGGYHNPSLNKIAFSDDPLTWHPVLGWPVKDSIGNPIILSDQDSYCVYSDSNNSVSVLGIFLNQTGYVFANDSAQDIIFFKFEIRNQSSNDYDSIYFALYCDIDVGDVSGGAQEYADDRVGFSVEDNFLYFFDDGFSPDWPDSTTGYFGITFLKTPITEKFQSGITDFHYNLYEDDVDDDTIQYGIFSSSEGLYNSNIGYKYFHPGTTGNIHIDDTSTVPQTGLDIVATISSGPYLLNANQSLVFYTAIIGGDNYSDIYKNMITAQNVFNSTLTQIEDKLNYTIPANFELYQNYPNPFNPGTVISYQLPVNSDVVLKVFDVLGNEIATLVDEYKPAGGYEVEFDASRLASGIYIYKLQAGEYMDVRKMILLK